jgi:hypothetical protein
MQGPAEFWLGTIVWETEKEMEGWIIFRGWVDVRK